MNKRELIDALIVKASMIELGEKIAWGSETGLMREAARQLDEATPTGDTPNAGLIEAELARKLKWAIYDHFPETGTCWEAQAMYADIEEVVRQHTQPAVDVEQGVEATVAYLLAQLNEVVGPLGLTMWESPNGVGGQFYDKKVALHAWLNHLRPTTQAAGRDEIGLALWKANGGLESVWHSITPIENGRLGEVRKAQCLHEADFVLAALQQGGSQIAVGDSVNGPKSDGLNVGSFTRAEGGAHD